MNLSLKAKIISAIIAIGLLLIAVFRFGFDGTPIPVVNNTTETNQSSDDPSLISSDPPQLFLKEPLVVSPNQTIKLNFNVALMNGPETKITMNPAHDIDLQVENDNKTLVIKPKTPYKLGQGYTISIKSEAKLRDEGKVLGKSYDLLFNVINYSGV